jgi:hypothetical protein
MQEPPASWLEQLDALLDTVSSPTATDTALLTQAASLDPDLLLFLVERLREQETAQSAEFLEMLAVQPETADNVRTHARQALEVLAEKGIHPPTPGEERFYAGYITQSRERGEQIMMLGWRLPDGVLEAFVFLLDWRSDGLRDFYRTRSMTADEWQQLLEHNSAKSGPLTEISLGEARALLTRADAVRKRFSRPEPREYRLERPVIERRLLGNVPEVAPRSSFIPGELAPEDVISAYVAAAHYRDYALMATLLAAHHPLRSERGPEETAGALQAQMKHEPRREEKVLVITPGSADNRTVDEPLNLETEGSAVLVEKNGRRRTVSIRERYTLIHETSGWRILKIEDIR